MGNLQYPFMIGDVLSNISEEGRQETGKWRQVVDALNEVRLVKLTAELFAGWGFRVSAQPVSRDKGADLLISREGVKAYSPKRIEDPWTRVVVTLLGESSRPPGRHAL